MRLKPGFKLREIAEDYVVVPAAEHYLDFGAVISLNETGAFLWDQLQDSKTFEELTEALAVEYDGEQEEIRQDIRDFITLLKEQDLLCEV